jgi:hypothetical protein
MKQDITLTFCYFLYLGMAIFLHPVKSLPVADAKNYCKVQSVKQDKLVAMESTAVLHGELLFKY